METDKRVLLIKKWAAHQANVSAKEVDKYQTAMKAQEKALDLLHNTRPDLYKYAIQPCLTTVDSSEVDEFSDSLLPITFTGPYLTPPTLFGEKICATTDYNPPDGEVADISHKITYDFELDKTLVFDLKGVKKGYHRKF